jgi:plasmid stabilization system protein ParE
MIASWPMTNTAITHLQEAVERTALRRGYAQAIKYRDLLRAGFQEIAEHHNSFHSSDRKMLAQDTNFELHLVEHHYIALKIHDDKNIIIVGIFHEKMNIPVHLRQLQKMSRSEILKLESEIKRESF